MSHRVAAGCPSLMTLRDAVLTLVAMFVLGCTSTPDLVPGGSTEAVTAGAPAAEGALLWPVEASQVIATRRGEYPPKRCQLAAGELEGADFRVSLPSGVFEFAACIGQPRAFTGTVQLDAGQLARFDQAMQALRAAPRSGSWADYPVMVLGLTTSTGLKRYEDDRNLYAPPARADTTYLNDAEPVFALFDEFAGLR